MSTRNVPVNVFVRRLDNGVAVLLFEAPGMETEIRLTTDQADKLLEDLCSN